MKKTIIISIVVFILFVIAYSFKLTNKEDIQKKREFSSQAVAGNMLRVSVRGHVYEIDRYEYPDAEGELPEGDMTLDRAKQVCESVGKRLCTDEEWTEACRGSALNKYSYGEDFKDKICNSLHHDRRNKPAGYYAECRTQEGLYDMSGNLWEWVTQSETTALRAKGGSFRDGEIAQRCSHTLKLFPVQTEELAFDNFGVRCCRDAVDNKTY